MTTAAYNSKVQIAGTSTVFTAIATSLVSGTTYQIDDTDKRVIDPDQTVTWLDAGVPVVPAFIDYLYGRARFTSPPGGAVTVTGQYLPLWEVTTAREFDLSTECDLHDVTKFKSTSFKQRIAGLIDVAFMLRRLDVGGRDYDTGAGNIELETLLAAGTTKIIEFLFGNSGSGGRVAGKFDKDTLKTAVGGYDEGTITGKLAAVRAGADISYSDFLLGGY